jgi:hypothetical protein
MLNGKFNEISVYHHDFSKKKNFGASIKLQRYRDFPKLTFNSNKHVSGTIIQLWLTPWVRNGQWVYNTKL